MKRFVGTMLSATLVAVLWVLPLFNTAAQGTDCGNGLLQRLQVGGRGWINLDPPLLPTRVRSSPSGDIIDTIQPGTSFTILAGPECNAIGTSWWHIETDDGITGWIPEGDAKGYYVDPLESVAVSSDCASTPQSYLHAGQTVRIINPEGTPTYLIHEQFPGQWDRESSLQSAPDHINYEREPIDSTLILAEGPVCLFGEYVWRVLGTPRFAPSRWVLETFQGEDALEVVDAELPFSVSYSPIDIALKPITSAPIIDALAQMSPMPGGGDIHLDLDSVYIGSPLAVLPLIFPREFVGQTASLTTYQPDGSIFSHTSEAIIDLNRQAQILFKVPALPGQALGVWRVDTQIGSAFHKSWTYTLEQYQAPQLWPDKHGGAFLNLTDEGEPIFVLTGFEPESQVELVLIEHPSEYSLDLNERYRWTVTVGEHGEAILRPQSIDMSEYFLIVADENGEWVQRYYDSEMIGDFPYDGGSNFVSRFWEGYLPIRTGGEE